MTTRSITPTTKAIAFALVVAAVTALMSPAVAAGNGSWAVTPSSDPDTEASAERDFYFYEAAPGSVIEDWVSIKNLSDEPLSFDVFGADAFNLEDGSWALREIDDEMIDIGAWVTVNDSDVTIEPETELRMPIRIEIPADASPGDYAGGIVARNKAVEGLQEDEGLQIGLQRAVGTRMFVRVTGVVRPAMAITAVTISQPNWLRGGPVELEYTLKNVGNMRLSPRVAVAVEGLLLPITDLEEHEIPVLLPQQTATRTIVWDEVPPIDLATVNVVALNESLVAPGSATAVVVAPWVVGVLVGLLIAGTLVIARRRRKQRAVAADEPEPLVSA